MITILWYYPRRRWKAVEKKGNKTTVLLGDLRIQFVCCGSIQRVTRQADNDGFGSKRPYSRWQPCWLCFKPILMQISEVVCQEAITGTRMFDFPVDFEPLISSQWFKCKCILHHLRIYYKLTMWPGWALYRLNLCRALRWYRRGHGFGSRSGVSTTAMIWLTISSYLSPKFKYMIFHIFISIIYLLRVYYELTVLINFTVTAS